MQYDLGNLRKLSDNDETFILDMLQTFKKTSPPIIERMKEYLLQQKYEAIGREAHKMIPGVSFLGAKQLQEVLVKIEETAKSGKDLENMATLVPEAIQQTTDLIHCFENDFPGKI
jgi:HPt (histidine-containing phosphotransfer) domain-containing protein